MTDQPMPDVIINDVRSTGLDFAVLASMHTHTLDANAIRLPHQKEGAKRVSAIETIPEDGELDPSSGMMDAQPLDINLTTRDTKDSRAIPNSENRGQNGANLLELHSPFAQQDGYRRSPRLHQNSVPSRARTASDSAIIFEKGGRGNSKHTKGELQSSASLGRPILRLSAQSRGSDLEMSQRVMKMSPKPRASPRARLIRSLHHKSPKPRRKNFAMDLTNDPADKKACPI